MEGGERGAKAGMQYKDLGEFFQARLENCFFDYVPGTTNPDILIVAFEGAGGAYHRPDQLRTPFGAKYYIENGYALLGVKPINVSWYRTDDVLEFFTFLKQIRFFDSFRKVVFAGGSMGGYASLAFSSLVPGSVVIALQPQSTMDPSIVPWERRFPVSRDQDWSGPFADGAVECRTASQVIVVYDPYDDGDARHAHRVGGDNVIHVPIRFVGHNVGGALKFSGTLKDFMKRSIENGMDKAFAREVSVRCRNSPLYYEGLINRCLKKKKLALGVKIVRSCPLAMEENPRLWMAAAALLEEAGLHDELMPQWKAVCGRFQRSAALWIKFAEYQRRLGRERMFLSILERKKDVVIGPAMRDYIQKNNIKLPSAAVPKVTHQMPAMAEAPLAENTAAQTATQPERMELRLTPAPETIARVDASRKRNRTYRAKLSAVLSRVLPLLIAAIDDSLFIAYIPA